MSTIKYLLDELEILVNSAIDGSMNLNDSMQLHSYVTDLVRFVTKKDLDITSFISLIKRDYTVATHSINVAIYAAILGKSINLTVRELKTVVTASLLHDIGKGSINEGILLKNESLTEIEFIEMKKHTLLGYQKAKKLGIDNRDILVAINHHHERMDGSGYPNGIKGELITKYARIVGICDIFDAMTSARVFQSSTNAFDVLFQIKEEMKDKVDPVLLKGLIAMLSNK